MAASPAPRSEDAYLCQAMQQLSVLRGRRRGSRAEPLPASPAASAILRRAGPPVTPVVDPEEVERLGKALAQQAAIVDESPPPPPAVVPTRAEPAREVMPERRVADSNASGANAAGTSSDVAALAAQLDSVLSTAAWEEAAPLIRNIMWMRHPGLAKSKKPTRRGSGSKGSSRRRSRGKSKDTHEKPAVPAPAASRRKQQHRRGATRT
jgi:hypothetical protein